jgi:hypothetical protein
VYFDRLACAPFDINCNKDYSGRGLFGELAILEYAVNNLLLAGRGVPRQALNIVIEQRQ